MSCPGARGKKRQEQEPASCPTPSLRGQQENVGRDLHREDATGRVQAPTNLRQPSRVLEKRQPTGSHTSVNAAAISSLEQPLGLSTPSCFRRSTSRGSSMTSTRRTWQEGTGQATAGRVQTLGSCPYDGHLRTSAKWNVVHCTGGRSIQIQAATCKTA